MLRHYQKQIGTKYMLVYWKNMLILFSYMTTNERIRMPINGKKYSLNNKKFVSSAESDFFLKRIS